MNTAKQTTTIEAAIHVQAREVYIPPNVDDVDSYAHEVCNQYRKRYEDIDIGVEFTHGFKAFVRAVVKAYTNNANRGTKP